MSYPRAILITDAGQQIVTSDLPAGDGYFAAGKALVARLTETTSARTVRLVTRGIDPKKYVQMSPALLVALVADVPGESTHLSSAVMVEQHWAVGVLVQSVDDASDAALDEADRLIEEALAAVPGWAPAEGRGRFERVRASTAIQYGDN